MVVWYAVSKRCLSSRFFQMAEQHEFYVFVGIFGLVIGDVLYGMIKFIPEEQANGPDKTMGYRYVLEYRLRTTLQKSTYHGDDTFYTFFAYYYVLHHTDLDPKALL